MTSSSTLNTVLILSLEFDSVVTLTDNRIQVTKDIECPKLMSPFHLTALCDTTPSYCALTPIAHVMLHDFFCFL